MDETHRQPNNGQASETGAVCTSRTRQSRRVSTPRRAAVRVTERDTWLLEALATMRFLTTSQIARLFFGGSRWAANKRLRRVFDAGLVQVWVRSLSEDNIYAVSRRGLRCIEDHSEDLALHATAPRGLDGNLTHLLAINQVRIALALTLPHTDGAITWWRSDWDLRAHGRERLIPDALFEVAWAGHGTRTLALELDNHTKSPRRFLHKVLAYASRRHRGQSLYGLSEVVLLVVGRDPRWVERYRQSLDTIRQAAWIGFTTLELIEDPGPVTPIWQVAGDDDHHSLRDLVFRPYRKDGQASETTLFVPG